MTRLAPARIAALRLLGEIRRTNGRARDVLRTSKTMNYLSVQDRALTTRLVLGCVRSQGLLDEIIGSHLKHGGHLEPRLRDCLRMSSFELLSLHTPPAVTISQGVDLAGKAAPRARGLANAVLHRVAEEDVSRMAAARSRLAAGDCDVRDLALVGALPAWLASALADSCGAALSARLALDALEPPMPVVAANHSLANDEKLVEELVDAGLEPAKLAWPGAFRLGRPSGLARSGLVETTRVLPCDLASQIVAWIACPVAKGGPATLLELGQGRGTKTILLAGDAERMKGPLVIWSLDDDAAKVDVARRRVKASGLSQSCQNLVLDARELADTKISNAPEDGFDTVFVDAPCSGTGTLRRHPEIPWSLQEQAACAHGSLPELQLAMLRQAATKVRSGGVLVYATCSRLRSENEDVVRAFLSGKEGVSFQVCVPTDAPSAAYLEPDARKLLEVMVTAEGFLRTDGAAKLLEEPCDGHFLAYLVRRA